MTQVMAFGEFELDVARFELRRASEPVAMEPQVFDLLAYLVANHDRVVLKDELIEHIWPERYISEAALASRVMAARRAVDDNGTEQKLIRTVRGRGFRFIGEVTTVELIPSAASTAQAPAAFVAVEAAATTARQPGVFSLDVAATSFVGRDDELRRLEEMLARPACRLVTIAGPGGVGKTRLAVALAERLEATGANVVTIALPTVHTPHELHAAIAGALGLRLSSVEPEAIALALGEREAVLLLDNFEHLAGVASESLARLLQAAPGLRLVVTSREVLALREEWLFPVAGLALDASDRGQSEAAQLFLDREAQSGVSAGAGNDRESIEQICRIVDGMPLGIELAASLRRYLTRDEIAAQVGRDIAVLRSDVRNLPARHRSISALLDESIARLSEEQCTVLLALSVFEGSFTLAAAAHIAGASLEGLRELVDRSLVQPRQGRFALHALLRQYARERLGFEFEVRQRAHSEYYTTFLAERIDALESAAQLTAATEIDEEFPNVLAAWRWACDHQRMDLLSRAAYPLYLYAQLRARFMVVREALEQAIAAADRAGEEHWRTLAALLVCRTWSLIRTSRGPAVIENFERAVALYRDHGEPPEPGFGMDPATIQSMIHWGAGRYPGIELAARDAEVLAHSRNDVIGEAWALWLRAVGLNRQTRLRWEWTRGKAGRYWPANAQSNALLEQADDLLNRAEGLLSGIGETWLLSSVYLERAVTWKAWGDADRYIEATQRALELREIFADMRGMGEALVNLADCYVDNADADAAASCLARVEPLARQSGDAALANELERGRALSAWLREEYDDAIERSLGVAERSIEVGSTNNVAAALRCLGDVAFERGDYRTAAELHVFVSAHPSTTPFSAARSEAMLIQIESHLPSEQMETLRERIPQERLRPFAAAVVERFRAGATSSPAPRG